MNYFTWAKGQSELHISRCERGFLLKVLVFWMYLDGRQSEGAVSIYLIKTPLLLSWIACWCRYWKWEKAVFKMKFKAMDWEWERSIAFLLGSCLYNLFKRWHFDLISCLIDGWWGVHLRPCGEMWIQEREGPLMMTYAHMKHINLYSACSLYPRKCVY